MERPNINPDKHIEKMIKEEQKKEPEKINEIRAQTKLMGAEKATSFQIHDLRKEIDEEEERILEREAQIKVMGKVVPDKATEEQEKTFKPLK